MTDIHGLTVLSLYDAVTGDVVQLNDLGDDSTVIVRAPYEGDGMENPTGGQFYGGDVSRLEVTSVDWAVQATLEQWQREGRRISAAGVGPSGALLWQERDLIKVTPEDIKGAAGGARGFRVTMERTGHGAHRIWWDNNLLDYIGWELAGGMALPVNLIPSGVGGWTLGEWDGGQAEIESGGAGTLRYADLVFPVSGVQLTASIQLLGGPAGWTTELAGLAYAGTALGQTVIALTGTGQKGATLRTPAGTWALRFTVLNADAAGAAVFANPALRVGTRTDAGRLGPARGVTP